MMGGVLAEPYDQLSMEYITSNVQTPGSYVWLGASDVRVEGSWVWETSGLPLSLSDTRWDMLEPNGGVGENCLNINPDGTINDAVCASGLFEYICQKEQEECDHWK